MKNIVLDQETSKNFATKAAVMDISREFMFTKHDNIKASWDQLREDLLEFYEKEYIPIILKNLSLKASFDKLTIAMKIKNIISSEEIDQNNKLLKLKLEDLYRKAMEQL